MSAGVTNAEVLPKRVASLHSDTQQLVDALAQVRRTRQVLLLARKQKLLRGGFPAAEDEKLHAAMMANLQVVVDGMVRKYYIEELKSEMLALYGLWDEFPPAPPIEKGDLPLEDQLIGNLQEL